MDASEQIRRLDLHDAYSNADADYIDENIALYMNFKDIPVDHGAFRLDMYVILACIHGKMKLDINCMPYTIQASDVIMCLPNRLVSNCLLSPDFEGMMLCISHKALRELTNDNMLWERGLAVMNRPLVHISDESAHCLVEYGNALNTAIRSPHRLFRRQVIISLVRTCLYELMSNVDMAEPDFLSRFSQKEYLFRSFIELLNSLEVKQRAVQPYADRLNVTPKYLSAVCKEVSGRTAFQWISESVQKDITFWLQSSERTIKEIVYILDFPNISFFGKYCRQHFGMSPTSYREHLRRNVKE